MKAKQNRLDFVNRVLYNIVESLEGCDFLAKLAPSILGTDYLSLSKDLEILERAGTEFIHVDVMDGIFVPNISIGVPVIKSIKKHTKIPLDVHLMIDRPHRYIEDFAKVSDILGFHYEAGSDVKDTLLKIKELGCKTCLTIKPKTEPEEIFQFLPLCDIVLVMSVEPGFGGQAFMKGSLEKLRKIKKEITARGLRTEIEIDGGINEKTGKEAVEAGADILVVGSYLFSQENLLETAKKFRQM